MKKKVQICFESGMVILEFDSLEKAKYALYSRKKDQYVYKVPKSEIIVKRAVQKYEIYLKEIRNKLIKAFVERGADKTIAEGLAAQVFEEICPIWGYKPRHTR